MKIDNTLEERGQTYGQFEHQAKLSQELKRCVHRHNPSGTGVTRWQAMPHAHREAIDMILHKVARLVNGDHDHIDGWHDIAGYATLVEKILSGESP